MNVATVGVRMNGLTALLAYDREDAQEVSKGRKLSEGNARSSWLRTGSETTITLGKTGTSGKQSKKVSGPRKNSV